MSSPRDNPLAQQRLGDFEIVREVGRGGMGVVYEARQVSLNRKVALKVLSNSFGLSPKAVPRFRREAEAAAKLHHTNIVPVYATGEENGTHFYAMELIEGPALDAVIRQLRQALGNEPAAPLPPTPNHLDVTGPYVESSSPSASAAATSTSSSLSSDGHYFDTVAKLIADVADALDYAHEQGVIHRDIKPSNLLQSPDGRLSINDFGLARLLEAPGMTMTGEFVGTPAYMSPEQITAGRVPIDHRTDIYSLGATLYELLTLQPPFAGEQRDQLLAQILHKEPRPPRRVNRKVPLDLETICLKAIDKDPDRRYQTAGALAADLRRYVNRFAIQARRAGPLTRMQKWVKRNPGLAAVGLVGLLAVGMAGFFAWRAYESQRQRIAEIRAERRASALDRAVTAALNGDDDRAEKEIAAAEVLGAAPGEVSKLRGIIAFYKNDYADSVTHLTIADEALGSSVAIKSLLAMAYLHTADVRAAPLIVEASSLQARTPEDYLFHGQLICNWGDPQMGLQEIERAGGIKDSPIARLVRAQARLNLAFETGAEVDALKTLRDAEVVRESLPSNDVVLATLLGSRLQLWDIYDARQGPGDRERVQEHRDEAGKLAKATGSRREPLVVFSCVHYWRRCANQAEERKYLQRLWDTTRYYFAGTQLATFLLRSGDPKGALEILELAKEVKALDPALWVIVRAELGKGKEAYREVKAQPHVFMDFMNMGQLSLLLGEQAESRASFQSALDAGRVPPAHRGWYAALVGYGAGECGPTEQKALLDRAGTSRTHLCEAHYLIGLRHLAHGDRKQARRHFEQVIETRVFVYSEYMWAGVFLARMDADPNWPGWLPEGK